jgi:hypothetical protein
MGTAGKSITLGPENKGPKIAEIGKLSIQDDGKVVLSLILPYGVRMGDVVDCLSKDSYEHQAKTAERVNVKDTWQGLPLDAKEVSGVIAHWNGMSATLKESISSAIATLYFSQVDRTAKEEEIRKEVAALQEFVRVLEPNAAALWLNGSNNLWVFRNKFLFVEETTTLTDDELRPFVERFVLRLYREPIPKSVRRSVWQRDQGRCVECGSRERLEYDHTIPLIKGGSNTERNLRLLCERCNRQKGGNI